MEPDFEQLYNTGKSLLLTCFFSGVKKYFKVLISNVFRIFLIEEKYLNRVDKFHFKKMV